MEINILKTTLILCLVISFAQTNDNIDPVGKAVPILTVHGYNDECHPELDLYLGLRLHVFSTCIEPSDYPADPAEYSKVTPIKEQGEKLCKKVLNHPSYQGKFDILGISQGTILSRYLIQYCPLQGKIRNFIALGGPVNGINGSYNCHDDNLICRTLRWLNNKLVFFYTHNYAPAAYWRIPEDHQKYLKYSPFLAEANNESSFNQTRKDGFLKLEKVLFIKWEEDLTIKPRESSWFGQYDENYNVLTRFETEVYKKDLVGIKTLEEDGRAKFITIPGGHGRVTLKEIEEVMIPFFSE